MSTPTESSTVETTTETRGNSNGVAGLAPSNNMDQEVSGTNPVNPTGNTTDTSPAAPTQRPSNNMNEQDLIEEMRNFDNLLKMLSVYKDNPDLRGNPNDRNIVEIAKVLSNFIGDDPDSFLNDEDDEESEDSDGSEDANTEEKLSTNNDKSEQA